MGVLFQDFMSYDLSAAENVGVGDLERLADRAAVEAAGRRAGAHDAVAGYAAATTRCSAGSSSPRASRTAIAPG
jgi:ABC-type multidrug transport system fused ATPase/permease subunit